MNTERWRVLSEWHNTWLAAPTELRAGLRASFATEHPDLLQVADELASSSGAVDGFLETPALVLAARDLAQDEPPLPDGTLVGPYRIVTLLARGGMGDVYRATDGLLSRTVAVKVLAERHARNADVRARFTREARAAARLSAHPNVVTVFDVVSVSIALSSSFTLLIAACRPGVATETVTDEASSASTASCKVWRLPFTAGKVGIVMLSLTTVVLSLSSAVWIPMGAFRTELAALRGRWHRIRSP